jgi:hypothetical protein
MSVSEEVKRAQEDRDAREALFRKTLEEKAVEAIKPPPYYAATRLQDQTPHLALPPLAAYLMARSVDRQEVVTKEMATMTKWIVGWTVAAVSLATLQIGLLFWGQVFRVIWQMLRTR